MLYIMEHYKSIASDFMFYIQHLMLSIMQSLHFGVQNHAWGGEEVELGDGGGVEVR